MIELLSDTILAIYLRGQACVLRHQGVLLFFCGIALLLNGMGDVAEAASGAGSGYSGDKYKLICQAILKIHEKDYGALLTSAAGIGAILASAMGGFKMAWACLVVALGSFLLKEYKNLFFEGQCG